jgi:hypothetical protein
VPLPALAVEQCSVSVAVLVLVLIAERANSGIRLVGALILAARLWIFVWNVTLLDRVSPAGLSRSLRATL